MTAFNYVAAIRGMSMHSTTKLVAITLATYADYQTGECWPTVEQLMADTGLSNRVVCEHIKHIESMGILAVDRSNGRRSYYKFIAENIAKAVTQDHQLRKVTSDAKSPQPVTLAQEAVTFPQKAVTESHTNNHKQPITTNKQPSVTPPPEKREAKPKVKKYDPQMLIDRGCSPELARDFCVHRETKKAPITETALNLIASQAAKANIEFVQAIQITISRGWVGFNASWKWQDDQPSATSKPVVQQTPRFGSKPKSDFLDITSPKKSNCWEVTHVRA